MEGRTTWKIRRTQDGYVGVIRFDAGAGPVAVMAGGGNERQALARAAVVANQIAQSPIFQAVAPPGTGAAIKAISMIAKSKDVQRVMRKFAGPGARRLAKVLRRFW